MTSQTDWRNVLVVDDDPGVLADFRVATRELPARLTFARSLAEARRQLAAEVPSVVFASYRLPDGDGLAFLVEVHGRHPGVTRILHTEEAVCRRVAGVDVPVLGKPCPRETLRELVSSLVADLQTRHGA